MNVQQVISINLINKISNCLVLLLSNLHMTHELNCYQKNNPETHYKQLFPEGPEQFKQVQQQGQQLPEESRQYYQIHFAHTLLESHSSQQGEHFQRGYKI
ncbi:hypothetical protein TTHERM_001009821 (macronuclear) [Tetrahymena thermophila SB210]|uniref:Uncharacterized protein n=1 Tax=Tetrahymena thermophila (strain SB210) TaxID=312017 RepID=W7XJ98_TETTS|nr:hypothetical protein TTHERM_001009821 [Tetrahymena thermophila SB210]EWS73979.1 hypothetical protein TTHERM_001009821 [Tetrahymena thermophila SB210]|eukprot:XP_012653482.1 hypothetical protein TTHERM_001009821 [Tetrahymena thermophila SB210]